MKQTWFVWFIITGVVIAIIMAFNHEGNKEGLPLSEIFPEEEVVPIDVEYEFIDAKGEVQEVRVNPVAQEEKVQESEESSDLKKEVEQTPSNTIRESPEIVIANVETPPPPVKSEPVQVNSTPPSTSKTTQEPYLYSIQIASFSKKPMAETLIEKLNKENQEAFLLVKDLGEKGIWYRVYVGRFSTKDQADRLHQQIKKSYPNSFVISNSRTIK